MYIYFRLGYRGGECHVVWGGGGLSIVRDVITQLRKRLQCKSILSVVDASSDIEHLAIPSSRAVRC